MFRKNRGQLGIEPRTSPKLSNPKGAPYHLDHWPGFRKMV
ncbi:hypothetical protein PIIN_05804 [Serendipita indica DSM 11827]|uniref:Uncharacterized protein n=1 Tax=Serendipita indica (strain DSM 11827) TaxID=1109443 RepID=G4TKM6_SERID|nr:hypothetical protein PIIN_05804 [Serendipita indica DSM 11827]